MNTILHSYTNSTNTDILYKNSNNNTLDYNCVDDKEKKKAEIKKKEEAIKNIIMPIMSESISLFIFLIGTISSTILYFLLLHNDNVNFTNTHKRIIDISALIFIIMGFYTSILCFMNVTIAIKKINLLYNYDLYDIIKMHPTFIISISSSIIFTIINFLLAKITIEKHFMKKNF